MRTVIDIDKDVLSEVQKELGTSTMKETVHAAFRCVLEQRAERQRALESFEYWRNRDNSDLLDPEIMKDSWRRRD